ncbi:uncharacterized protein BYT42DRAFT_574313 [Radiomyces spectabilis]|uniref:uncharacterized protein n=1 Tax=Radiomyces spectabilis TaxID=64574 RepID=UPI0022201DCE|nr:uncharacterized protein BYT42DRAFT_574313 [Radiomyces spectabilis]KAI8376357.1 hypothetical protein BYT42DRAFT_574313 [Radiomyces spectabilis]
MAVPSSLNHRFIPMPSEDSLYGSQWHPPAIDSHIEEIEKRLSDTLGRLKRYHQQTKASFLPIQQPAHDAVTKLQDAQQRLQADIDHYARLIDRRNQEIPEKEAAIQALSSRVDQQQARHANNMATQTQLKNQVNTWLQRKNSHIKELLEQQQEIAGYNSMSLDELASYEKYLQFSIVTEKENEIKFEFRSIDLDDPDRVCVLVLNMSQSPYSVASCDPPLDQLSDIMAAYHGSEDAVALFCSLRQAWLQQIEQQKL